MTNVTDEREKNMSEEKEKQEEKKETSDLIKELGVLTTGTNFLKNFDKILRFS